MKATILKALFIAPFVGWAAWLNASEPMVWATPSGQPALVNHAAYGVDGPTGFDQAQGER
jgi:hypothetical protein